MTLSRAKLADRLYEEVAGYDIVMIFDPRSRARSTDDSASPARRVRRNAAPSRRRAPRDRGGRTASLDGLGCECHVDGEVTVPLTVDGRRMTVSSVVDLVHVTPDCVGVIDYETDRRRYGSRSTGHD